MSHTTGPWHSSDTNEITARWPNQNGDHIATVWEVGEPEVTAANAKLIAAAPDLLAALQAFVDDMDVRFDEIPDDFATYHAAKQAIAEAT